MSYKNTKILFKKKTFKNEKLSNNDLFNLFIVGKNNINYEFYF